MKYMAIAFCALAGMSMAPASAATITNGFTFAVASGCGDTSAGNHFHSSTGGDFGNPAGRAEVGSFGGADCEEVRGLSEYDLAGLGAAASAFVTFDVDLLGGLFPGDNDFLYTGMIDIFAYQGNNAEDVSDYQAASTGFVGSFSTAGLSIGDTLSFDITTIFNTAIAAMDNSLGIMLRIADAPNGGAITFLDFRLTTDDQTSAVPIPAAALMFPLGIAALRMARKKKAA